jgi:hypothetical protein
VGPVPVAVSLDPAGLFDLPADGRLEPFSLRAQPLPLKWTAGGVNDRFIAPPQIAQTVGPCASTECTTSTS